MKWEKFSCLPFSAGGGRIQPWRSLPAAEQGTGRSVAKLTAVLCSCCAAVSVCEQELSQDTPGIALPLASKQ